jgi:hypothetical protein
MKPTVLCQICGKLIELTDFNFDKHRVCGKKCHQEWDWRYSLGIMREEYRSDPAAILEVEQEAASAAVLMRKAGVPNMLEGRVLGLKIK